MDGFSTLDSEEYYEQSPIEKIQGYLPMIIGAIVLIAIVYFVYTFFIGNNTDVTFSIKDISGKPITGNSIRVFSSSENKEVFKASGKAGYDTKLKFGDYKITVSSSDFPLYVENIAVDQENNAFDVVLKKQYKLDLGIAVTNNKLIKGIDNSIEITITNNGNEDISDLALDLNFSNKAVMADSVNSIMAIAGTQTKIKAIAKIQPSITLSRDEKTKGITISAKVVGTNISKKIDGIFIIEKPVLEVSPKEVKMSLSANDIKTQEINMQNKGGSPITGISLEILIDDSSGNDKEEAANWVYFTSPGKTTELLELLPEGQQRQKSFTVNAPKAARLGTISGSIKISTAKEIGIENIIPFSIEINKEVGVKLTVDFEMDVFNLKFNGNKYPSQTKKIIITNNSDVDIETPITFNVSNKDECSEDWFKFESGNNIKSLKKGEKNSNLYYTVSAPKEVAILEEGDRKAFCKINMSYKNPVNEKTEVQEFTVFINAGS
ncbi:MAG: hypothetical protein COT15_05185 [Candidatus Diapherotrites archaeon CG08_land_8_20_14_0_20_34_12]|nr:MAG: hypothetical protein COT15_05185 [Candidatus Diapherotrites archaeon CG08_land_8_20_14_0_20_34_12]